MQDKRIICDEFYFENIDCPSCALKIENNLNKEERIISCVVNYVSKKIIIEHYSDDDVLELVNIIASKTEKNVIIYKNKSRKMYLNHSHFHHYDNLCNVHQCKINKRNNIYKILYILALICGFCASILQFLSLLLELRMILFVFSYLVISKNLLLKMINQIKHKDIFNENTLMVVASFGALVIFEGFEALMVILLNTIGEYYKNKAINKSKQSISELIDTEQNQVTLLNNIHKNVDEVKINDILIIAPGEKILLDGILLNHEAYLDLKSLTGESLPKMIYKDQEILSGSINLNQVIQIKVTKIYQDSTLSKVKRLIEQSLNKKAKSQELITKFSKMYTPIVFLLSLMILIVNISSLTIALEKAFSLLVISCPCALVISIPLCYFASIGRCSKEGVLVKGGNYLEALTNIDKIVFDKTGTLTKGDFEITKITSDNQEEFLFYLYKCEYYSSHPLALAIKKHINQDITFFDELDIQEIKGYGMVYIENEDTILCGNAKLLNKYGVDFKEAKEEGSIIYVSKNKKLLGYVVLEDSLRTGVEDLFSYLNTRNHLTYILSGDVENNVKKIADKLNIKYYFHSLLPDQKLNIVTGLKEKKKILVYVGDGINDSPSLALSDVGISLGGIGSDVAKECADIIVMNDDITKISKVIEISKFTKKIIIENILMILLVKFIAIVISYLGIFRSFSMIFSIFADVGICLISILNTLRIQKYKVK